MVGNPHRDLSGRRVLFVEDEWLIALDLKDTLEEWGCRVTQQARRREATSTGTVPPAGWPMI